LRTFLLLCRRDCLLCLGAMATGLCAGGKDGGLGVAGEEVRCLSGGRQEHAGTAVPLGHARVLYNFTAALQRLPRAPQPQACAEPRLSPRGFRPRRRQPGGGGWAGETIICSCSMGSHIPGFSVPGEPSARRHGDFTDPLPLPLLPHLVPFNGRRRHSACAPANPSPAV
jgi:hypothetical protein